MKKIENSFVVSGYVSNDAQIRSFETASVARFSIAVSRSEKKGEETVYTSAFLPVEAWRKNEAADSFDRIKKGELLTVKGYFKPEEWTESETNKKRNRIVMVAVEFYPTPEKEEEDRIQIERWLRPPFFYALSRIVLAYTQFSYSHHPAKVCPVAFALW